MKVYAPRFNIYLWMFAALALFSGCQTHHSVTKESKEISALRIHMETNPDPSGTALTQTVSVLRAEPVSVVIAQTPFLTEADVVAARVLDAPAGDGFAVEIKFSDVGTLTLEQFSASNPGKHFVVFGQWGDKSMDGRWLAAPLITHRITDGLLSFTPDMSRDDAYRLVLGLNNVSRQIAKGQMK